MKTAVYPGSFDPVTKGHLDIIERAAAIFDKVVVVAMVNSKKTAVFSLEERCSFLERCTKKYPNVEVKTSDSLLAEWVNSIGDCVLVKGLRAVSDFEREFKMAHINRKLNPKLETLFLPTTEEYLYLSSSVVKEVCSLGGDISSFVDDEILDEVKNKLLRGVKR